jgi:hypothetical protein
METRLPEASAQSALAAGKPVQGLPKISYYPPIIATLMAAVFIFVVLAVLTTFALLRLLTQIQYMMSGSEVSVVSLGICGLVTCLLLVSTWYFATAVLKGIRDLWTPVYYTRGTLVNRRDAGTRRTTNWLVVTPRYAGPDLSIAAEVTDEQRAASPDRSLIFQPRFTSRSPHPRHPSLTPAGASGYLPPDRISASAGRHEDEERPPRVAFRVDGIPLATLEAEEEILLAHSRYLQHIFYVAHLRGGEWESFRNKALI